MFIKQKNRILLWFTVAWATISSRSTRAFYDRIASFYDDIYVAHRVHAESVRDLLHTIYVNQHSKISVLDLGCGTGMLSLTIIGGGLEVVGADLSFSSLALLRQKSSKIKATQADAGCLPFPDGAFDTVVCLGAWRHFMDSEKVLEEVCRVLRHDGVFIVGYFPPAIAGIFNVKDNVFGNAFIFLSQKLTKFLRYFDRVDFSFEEETEEAIQRRFTTFYKKVSGSDKIIMAARKPLILSSSGRGGMDDVAG